MPRTGRPTTPPGRNQQTHPFDTSKQHSTPRRTTRAWLSSGKGKLDFSEASAAAALFNSGAPLKNLASAAVDSFARAMTNSADLYPPPQSWICGTLNVRSSLSSAPASPTADTPADPRDSEATDDLSLSRICWSPFLPSVCKEI